jgi:hypothetical protein
MFVVLVGLAAASRLIGLPTLEPVSGFGIESPASRTTLKGLNDSAEDQVGRSGFAGSVEALGHLIYLPIVWTQPAWTMAGANPQRTSWTAETLPGNIRTVWVKPIAPYVSQHVQVVGAAGKVYVSTAAGLYAFNASSGADVWQYPTELPLGHSPTYDGGYLYVGGMDRKLHKISASNGQGVWTFTAEGGFSTNPVVANGKVYAGNRDGAFYAVNTSDGSLAWKFQTGNQILQSAAYKLEDDGIATTSMGTLFFASNDGYAYALDAETGAQVWQSDSDPTTAQKDKFPSMGFYSWWPVVYGDYVIFTRTGFYATNGAEAFWLFCPPGSTLTTCTSIPDGVTPGVLGNETQSGYWPVGETILNVRSNPYGRTIPDYFETYPYRRNAFFVNRTTGMEQRFDIDNDGNPDYAPISWVGDAGTHDPPIVVGNATYTDSDDVLYFHTLNRSRSLSFSNANISGWKVGTPFLSLPTSYVRSSDEPTGISASGNNIYYNHCCDRGVGAIDVSRPNSTFPSPDSTREWRYITSGGLPFFSWNTGTYGLPVFPNSYYFREAAKFFWDPKILPNEPTLPCCAAVFWNENDKVGPATYQGKLYVILGNALVAIGQGGSGTNAPVLPSAPFVSPPDNPSEVTDAQLRSYLEQEVSEIVASGHLKPSYSTSIGVQSRMFEDFLTHYWHNPADLHLVLLRALPHLSTNLQNQVKAYLQSEFALFSPAIYSHIGFTSGIQRDPYPYPPAETDFRLFTIPDLGPQTGSNFEGWSLQPNNVYALWKYSQAGLGDAQTLLNQLGTRFKTPITANRNSSDASVLTDAYLKAFPNIHNAYIAGYIGYIELAKLAGQTQAQYAAYEAELERLKVLRLQNLMTFPNPQEPWMCENECYFESLITYYNFAYMTPELADYLATNARSLDPNKDILSILQKYQDIAPYWMVAHNGETQGELAIMPYQQTHSLFQAFAMVKNDPREELVKYLDTPIVPVGDLYYIDNLVSVLESP